MRKTPVILCLGEALVDLICERPVASLTEADSFTPHFGGALANVAVAASRAGADAGLAGAAGDDEWGRWLRDAARARGRRPALLRAARGRADADRLCLVRRASRAQLPDLWRRGRDRRRVGRPAGRGGDRRGDGALVFSSTTLATPASARSPCAPASWRSSAARGSASTPTSDRTAGAATRAAAAEASRELIEGSFLVRANREEAIAIAGVDDPRAAAERARRDGRRAGGGHARRPRAR